MSQPLRILAIDDETKILDVVESYLVHAGYQVDRAMTGRTGLEAFGRCRPDLVILDLMLPDITGEEVCGTIRRQAPVPVLMLTARSGDEAVVRGLNLGADDYLTKPFSPRELVARVQALLRRPARLAGSAAQAEPGPSPAGRPGLAAARRGLVRAAGDRLVLDLDSCQASLDGRSLELTATEFRLLAWLAAHPRRVFSREELLDQLAAGGLAEGGSRTVDAHVKNLRRKLADQDHQLIQTVHGLGYRLAGEPAGDPPGVRGAG